MFELKHACHKVYVIKYHMIFCVKYRKDMFLNAEYVEHLKNILQEIEKRYYLTPETVGFDEDHVHLLMHAAPRYSPSHVCQIVKSITAREMFKQSPEIKKELWGGEFWSDGGYIGTVWEGTYRNFFKNFTKIKGEKGDHPRLFVFPSP